MSKGIYFRLFASCIPVIGKRTCMLYDLLRIKEKAIPKELCDVFEVCENKSIEDAKDHFDHKFDQGMDQYFDLLLREGWGFYTEEPERFPKLDMNWKSPSKITNAILDIDENMAYSILDTVKQLKEFSCKALQLRIFSCIPLDEFEDIFEEIQNSSISHVEFVVDKNVIELEGFKKLASKPPVTDVIVFGSEIQKHEVLNEHFGTKIIYLKEKLEPHSKEKEIPYFGLSMKNFAEAQNHHLGLNRKLCIDTSGYIRNFPSHKRHFGVVQDVDLNTAISSKEFQHYWNIPHDKVEGCKDCEFRYVCIEHSEIKTRNGLNYRNEDCPYKTSAKLGFNQKSVQIL